MLSIMFMTGLLGSLGHCLGMCGPLVLMVGSQFGQVSVLGKVGRFELYHGARILMYSILGLVFGAIGSLVGFGSEINLISGVISLVFGAVVILMGFRYLGWLPLGTLEGACTWMGQMMGKALQRGGLSGIIALGALNGLLPCGLVYSALLVATTTGSAIKAALAMAIFGLGTFTALFVLGMGATSLNLKARQVMSRLAGFLILLVGVQLMLRGAAGLGWLSHWMVGGLMIF